MPTSAAGALVQVGGDLAGRGALGRALLLAGGAEVQQAEQALVVAHAERGPVSGAERRTAGVRQ